MLNDLRFIKKTLIHIRDMSVMLQALFVLRQQAEEILRTFTEILQVLGKDEVMKRFDEAIESLRG